MKRLVILVMLVLVATSVSAVVTIRENYSFGKSEFDQLDIGAIGVWKGGTVAFSFTPQQTHYLNKLVLKACKTGNPGIITMRMREMPPEITYLEHPMWDNIRYTNLEDGNWNTFGKLPEYGSEVYESFTPPDDYYMCIGDGYTRGQSYTVEEDHLLGSLTVKARRIGNPGYLALRITAADENGFPTGPVLASASINADNFPVAPNPPMPIITPLNPPLQQYAGQKYCFYFISWDSYEDNVAEFVVEYDNNPGEHYAGGNSFYQFMGGPWYNDPLDLYFILSSPPNYNVAFSNYTLPKYVKDVTWYCKDDVGSYSYTFPQEAILPDESEDPATWINITMFYEPTGDGYMYSYYTKHVGMTAMPGAGGDRWNPSTSTESRNVFYEERLSFSRYMDDEGYCILEDDWREYDIVLKNFGTSGIKTWNNALNNWYSWSTVTIYLPSYTLVKKDQTYVITFSKNKEFAPQDGLYFIGVSYWDESTEEIVPQYTRGPVFLSAGTDMDERWWLYKYENIWFQEWSK